ncbi:hypothetical protein [[Limnothrix rosea] IAM M-220]|uniref:hypothetical protein n=1 Tax=[Limnothrix rosea] IAM M-220 TaxID=454133 RepID=UPI000966924E|nr:hypothetical protein [[Limnothrix rosea] IAM M-220]OKH18194.1 hypothetical protein NIES208_06630 [[Limnothrix rosea] IAM M-220]
MEWVEAGEIVLPLDDRFGLLVYKYTEMRQFGDLNHFLVAFQAMLHLPTHILRHHPTGFPDSPQGFLIWK